MEHSFAESPSPPSKFSPPESSHQSHFHKDRINEPFDNLAAASLRKALNASQDKTFKQRFKTGQSQATLG
jgi:hypothetical protein